MKGFEKGLSPSKSNALRNLSSSGWVENNENDSSGDKLIPQFEKITFGKHFSSVAQRKKILAEINEIPSVSDAQNHENCNLNLENSPQKMGISDDVASCCGNAYEPKDDSSVVYDPLKNYLSPRPQFLRFNPNRRRDILKRLEKESIDELNSSLVSDEVEDGQESSAEEMGDSSLSPPKVCVANQRNEGISEEVDDDVIDADVDEVEDEEEVEEDEEEERGWCLRGVLKLLLTLIACLLSTSYICSMNSPTNSPIQQAIWNLKDNGLVIKNGTHEFVSTRIHDDSFVQVEVGGYYRGIEEAQIYKENYGEIDESFEAEIVEYLEEWHEKEMIGYENEDSEDMVDEAAEYEDVGAAEFDFEVDKLQHLIDENAAENIDDGGMLLDQEVESSCAGSDEVNLNMDEAAEMEIIGSGEVDSEPQSSGQLIGATTVVSDDASESELEMEIDSSIELQGTELSLKSISEEIPTESKGADDTGSLELVESHGELSDSMDEVDEIGDEVQVGIEESEWNTSTVVGVSAAAFISTSLAIIYHSIKSRRSTPEVSEPVQKQKFAVEANVSAVHRVPSIERKVEFLARASMREAPRELSNHIYAPTVELISEIVVGQPSSIRSSGKYQTNISDNDYYATLSQKHDSSPQLVSAPSQPSAIEPKPTSSSTSYGSFTTEKKISKKEGGQSRESMIGTTPVRRSSRLRNRSTVMSP